MLHGVDQAEVTPVFAQDGEAFVSGAVLIGGVSSDEALDQIEVLVDRLDLGVAAPSQDLLLDVESGAVGIQVDLAVVVDAVVGDDEQLTILAQVLRLEIGDLLQVLVQVGGLLLRDVGQQVDQSAGLDQLLSGVGAVHQVSVVFADDLGAQGLVQVASQEFELELDAEFFFDQLVDLVVACGLIAGIAAEHGNSDGLLSCGRKAAQRQNHHNRQNQREQFTHGIGPP